MLDRTANRYPAVCEPEQRVMVGYLLHKGRSTVVTPKGVWRSKGWPVKPTWCSPGTAVRYLGGGSAPQRWLSGGVEVILVAAPAIAVYDAHQKAMVVRG